MTTGKIRVFRSILHDISKKQDAIEILERKYNRVNLSDYVIFSSQRNGNEDFNDVELMEVLKKVTLSRLSSKIYQIKKELAELESQIEVKE